MGWLSMIYITGDTHIPIDIQKFSTKRFPLQKSMTKNDYVIICGDFGGVWDGSNEKRYWIKWLKGKNFTTLFIDGNHENFDMLNTFPIVEFGGAKAHRVNDGIYHLLRGQVYTIDGNAFFTFGGASSHDKEHRKEGKNWWKDEMPSETEYKTAISILEKYNWSVDFIVTHCIATSIQREFAPSYEENELTEFLESVKNKLSYKKWFFGHYHIDSEIDSKHIALFDKIIPL